METVQEKTKRKWHSHSPSGVYSLKYHVRNSLGPDAFGGYHIAAYPSPYDSKDVYLRGRNDEAKKGMLLDKLEKKYYPDQNLEHRHIISWLIGCPEIKLEGFPEDEFDNVLLKSKNQVSKITLTWKDGLETAAIDKTDYIDRLLGILSFERGSKAIGLRKLRWILAALNMAYRDERHEGNNKTVKKVLRSRVKNYLKSSMSQAIQVSNIIDNLDEAKSMYEFKEMIRVGLLSYNGVSYKYNQMIIGKNYDEVAASFAKNEELRAALLNELYKKIDSEES